MTDDPWGEIDLRAWRDTPHLSGRLATDEDRRDGKAVFCQQVTGAVVSEPYPLSLPHAAILIDDEGSIGDAPVIVVQAERAAEQVLVGFRFLRGGKGVALLSDVELLDDLDERFGA
jgi:hypothetical protein